MRFIAVELFSTTATNAPDACDENGICTIPSFVAVAVRIVNPDGKRVHVEGAVGRYGTKGGDEGMSKVKLVEG